MAEILTAVEQMFDQLLGTATARWLVARTGRVLLAVDVFHLPPDAADLPNLDGAGFLPNIVSGAHGDFYQPNVQLLADSDPEFAFAVTQQGFDENGHPFNHAILTFSLRAVKPPNLDHIPFNPPVRSVPGLQVMATLIVPFTTRGGMVERPDFRAKAEQKKSDDTFVVTFELTGSNVKAAYAHLTQDQPDDRDGMALQVAWVYDAYQLALVNLDPFVAPASRITLFGDGVQGTSVPVSPPPPGGFAYFPVTARRERTTSIGPAFQTDAHRSRFTITAGGRTRAIIDAGDLEEATPRSEYRELTSLGDIQKRYPSLRQLYFGQVSGTVVAIPAAYGIVRGSTGLAATCDAVVDPSPDSTSGCRFHFTFTVTPLADPVDLAALALDLSNTPEAAGRTLKLILPSGLDTRRAPSLEGLTAGKVGFGIGAAAHTVQISVDIVDDPTTPAPTLANLFLQQLAAKGAAPLFGTLFVRVDDLLPHPIPTQVLLNLRQTAGTDDLSVGFEPEDRSAEVTNSCPFTLILHRYAKVSASAATTVSLHDQLLTPGKFSTLPVGDEEVTSVAVSHSMSVPAVVTKAQMLEYLTFNTTVVSQVQHPLDVNATAVDFAAASIIRIEVRISLTELPGLPIPAMTVTSAHPVDFVHIQVPVQVAITGLGCTVTLVITTATGQHSKTITHDFVDAPILTLTNTTIAP
ncbi:hypothetical protein [Nocardia sp. R7R-8]|uniref:hypothetical protein n=1 Tax=Nocardia sp. R7R-8 TaxID=3459304 RepID=UPI00403DB9D8